jgi:hypothetical protein
MCSDLFYIGEIDAESDKLLNQAFVRTNDYAHIMDPQIYIVVGRKGCGKTALFDTITRLEGEKYDCIVNIKLKDVNIEQLNILQEHMKGIDGFPQESFLRNTIQAFIWTSLMKALGERERGTAVYGPKATIYNYVTRERWVEQDFVSRLASYAISVLNHLRSFAQHKSTGEALKVFSTYPIGDEDYEKARHACIDVLRQGKSLVLVDDVDFDYRSEDYREKQMQLYYTCLVNAISSLATSEESRGILHPKLAISTDILYGLHLRHADKVLGHSHEIRWGKRELKEFISRRLRLSPTAPKGIGGMSDDQAWKVFFNEDETIKVEHDERLAFHPFDYIFEHSFHRPRDIMLCVRDIASEAPRPLGQCTADGPMVKAGVKRFCDSAVRFLEGEYHGRCPLFGRYVRAFHGNSKVMAKYTSRNNLSIS